MNAEKFGQNMTGLAETLGAPPLSEMSLEMYARALERFSDEEITRAIMKAAATCRWMPKPVELVDLISGGKQTPEARALLAWEQVYSAIGDHGAHKSMFFTDGRISRVIRLMGGWVQVCQWPEKDMKWHRKDFLEAYKSLPADTQPEILPGECARLAAIGHRQDHPAPVVIGDERVMIEQVGQMKEQTLALVKGLAKELSAPDEATR
jgi:hypothetical protein